MADTDEDRIDPGPTAAPYHRARRGGQGGAWQSCWMSADAWS
jgi:hypothetical protein